MTATDAIRDLLASLAPEHIEILDESHRHAGHAGAAGGGGHFALTIVSRKFANLSAIERHRQVYALLSALIPAKIHALSIVAHTPDERGYSK